MNESTFEYNGINNEINQGNNNETSHEFNGEFNQEFNTEMNHEFNNETSHEFNNGMNYNNNRGFNPETESKKHAPKQKKAKGGKTALKVAALALSCSLIGGAVGAGGMAVATNFSTNVRDMVQSSNASTIFEGSHANEALNVVNKNTGTKMTAAEIYAANVNSTVGITTSVTGTNFFGYVTTSPASGSGFILTENGYIVTNYHVIKDGSEIKVTTYDNNVYTAKTVGYDESNDIAVLKIDANGLTPVTLGDSDQMNVGDDVIAIGNPLGELTFSLTSGSVSALNRNITINETSMNLIQTDCAINSGNSGGALFNSYGEVIGITNAKFSANGSITTASIDNIGFAIPINNVRSILTEIIEDGTVSKPFIGVSVYDLGSDYQRFGLSGVVVSKVEENSPAEDAGLQENDIITEVNGKSVTSVPELKNALSADPDGEEVTLTIYRMGQTMNIDVKLTYKKQSALPENDTSNQREQQMPQTQQQNPQSQKQNPQDQQQNQQNQQQNPQSQEQQNQQWPSMEDMFPGYGFGNYR